MAEVKQSSDPLAARELEWAINSESLLDQHKKENGPIVRTRFPPEPNGYLHIGHAKSMNMNFSLAFEKLGVAPENRRTVFRYDDTNPDAESKEYIDSLRRDLEWLGWKPEKTTYSSDNFQALHDFAVILIRKGLAYVCDMTKAEMEIQRELALKRTALRNAGQDPDVEAPIPSPDILPGRNRNTPVERNLDLFSRMKMGLFEEGSWILNRQTLTCTIWWLIASSTLVTLTLAMDGASTLHTTSRTASVIRWNTLITPSVPWNLRHAASLTFGSSGPWTCIAPRFTKCLASTFNTRSCQSVGCLSSLTISMFVDGTILACPPSLDCVDVGIPRTLSTHFAMTSVLQRRITLSKWKSCSRQLV
jgi:tRNA synthetases class I (E and Q), catalytic domain